MQKELAHFRNCSEALSERVSSLKSELEAQDEAIKAYKAEIFELRAQP